MDGRYRSSLTQLEEKLSVSFKETTKGNEVIKKLQDQIKSYKSRVKGLKQVIGNRFIIPLFSRIVFSSSL